MFQNIKQSKAVGLILAQVVGLPRLCP